jgi:hypothetical protein
MKKEKWCFNEKVRFVRLLRAREQKSMGQGSMNELIPLSVLAQSVLSKIGTCISRRQMRTD